MKITKQILTQRQNLPLELKERLTERKIQEWYEHWNGAVYVAFSGGLDSTVLLHQVRKLYPDVPAVFVDTGLEYPENREFVATITNVEWLKPAIPFVQVIQRYGYPVIRKPVARFISDLQNPTVRNQATRNLRLTGYNRKGIYCPSMRIPQKWLRLVDAPFRVSDKCCDILKKQPIIKYAKNTGRKAMLGVLAIESDRREKEYIEYGCNQFLLKTPKSHCMGFWTTQDVLSYVLKHDLAYSKAYGQIVQQGDSLTTTGEKHTGCMFCLFGCHLEKAPNRFQRMRETHPAHYSFCIDKLECGKVLDFIGVKYN